MTTTMPSTQRPLSTPILVALVLMATCWLLARWMIPTHYLADDRAPIELEKIVPRSFGDWREDESLPYVLADPTLEKSINEIYSQLLNRTYVDKQGHRLMLSIAYGRNQNSKSTAAHRPEFCYSAQGFMMETVGKHGIQTAKNTIPSMRLVGRLADRVEPITYWVTLNETATLPGFSRKLQQLKFGLKGQIADGMLVRLSTIGPETRSEFEVQERFIKQWREAMPPTFDSRFFGS
jgi:EpsI family protein